MLQFYLLCAVESYKGTWDILPLHGPLHGILHSHSSAFHKYSLTLGVSTASSGVLDRLVTKLEAF